MIFSLKYLLAYAISLPRVPIGDMRKRALSVSRREPSVFIKLILLLTALAGKASAASLGHSLGMTVRAFIERAVEKIRSEALVNSHVILLLPGEIINSKFFFQYLV